MTASVIWVGTGVGTRVLIIFLLAVLPLASGGARLEHAAQVGVGERPPAD